MDPNDAWQQLHGQHEVPKQSYMNPFDPGAQDLSPERPSRHNNEEDCRDHIYSMEIDANLGKNSGTKKPQG